MQGGEGGSKDWSKSIKGGGGPPPDETPPLVNFDQFLIDKRLKSLKMNPPQSIEILINENFSWDPMISLSWYIYISYTVYHIYHFFDIVQSRKCREHILSVWAQGTSRSVAQSKASSLRMNVQKTSRLVESVLRNEPNAARNCPKNEITRIRERKRYQN